MKVRIRTPARLHFGIVDLGGELGRLFGSVGIAIDEPNCVLEVRPFRDLRVSGPGAERAKKLAERFLSHYGLRGGCKISIESSIPGHVGLGSGTQLALAIAKALSEIYSIKATVRELALVMGRGSVSGIGTGAFEKGGFLVDGGKLMKGRGEGPWKGVPPIIFNHSFPDDWMFVVAIPNVSRGLSGVNEERAFMNLPPISSEAAGKACRLVLMRMLPSVIEGDIQGFGHTLTQLQTLTGDCFSSVQGGRYCHPTVKECVELMLKQGAYGAGQSSWGPATYGLVRGLEQAERVKGTLEVFIEKTGGKVFHARADNEGAKVQVINDT